MPIVATLLAALGLGCGASSGSGAGTPFEEARSPLARERAPSDQGLATLAAGNRAFAFELLHELAKPSPGKNVAFSPYSAATALAMAYVGARGTTASEMQKALHFDLEQPALHEAFNAVDLALATRAQQAVGKGQLPFRLQVTNALWPQRGLAIVPAFLDTLAVHYGAGLYLLDYSDPEAARGTINAFIADHTEQRIPELLPPDSIASNVKLVLTNAVYFTASWATPFDEKSTVEASFTKLDGSVAVAPFMSRLGAIDYAQGANYEAIALPYAGNNLTFVAVLPSGGAYDSVEQSADGAWFESVRSELRSAQVSLALPKFRYGFGASLADALKALEMRSAFESTSADFSGMTLAAVFIKDVLHESTIEVSEQGTMASGATAVVFARKSAVQVERTVRFDRPFFYAILDQPTGQILFMGRVLDPAAH
jgi:serpin B